MDASPRFPVGCIHHATHLKQSPPLDGEEYREFPAYEQPGTFVLAGVEVGL